MTYKVVKPTNRGQITLPKNWRNHFKTDNFVLEIDNARIIIKPLYIEELSDEEVIFDADRDNNGKGVSPDEMIHMLKEVQNG